MKNLTCLLILLLACSCNAVQNLYVPMAASKRKLSQNLPEHVVRLYFDRKGFLYPEGFPGTDESIRSNDCRLERYYAANPMAYSKLCTDLGVTGGGSENLTAATDPLQKELIRRITQLINTIAQNRELVFIIHGFNEHPLLPLKAGATDEMALTEKMIKSHFPGRSFTFVEVYWDGLSKTGGFGNPVSRGLNSFKIWNNSQASATYVGLELRRLLSGLDARMINVVTHSHGAGVITNALFNVRKFKCRYYQDRRSWLYEIAQRYNNILYETPKQRIRIGMLAPAIPGTNVFDEYDQRTVNGHDIKDTVSNYYFLVGFNENDPVTSKFFLPAAFFGSTTLACRRKELKATELLININNQVMQDIDFSREKNGKQNSHDWFRYVNNPQFGPFIDRLLL